MKKLGLVLVFLIGTVFILGSADPNQPYSSYNYNNFDASKYDLSKQQKRNSYTPNYSLPDTPINRQYNPNSGYTPYGYKSSNGMIYNY